MKNATKLTNFLIMIQNTHVPKDIPTSVKMAIMIVSMTAFLILCIATKMNKLQKEILAIQLAEAESKRRLDYYESYILFMFTNIKNLQESKLKKIELDQRYMKNERNLVKKRQQANQEYLTAEKVFAERFNHMGI